MENSLKGETMYVSNYPWPLQNQIPKFEAIVWLFFLFSIYKQDTVFILK